MSRQFVLLALFLSTALLRGADAEPKVLFEDDFTRGADRWKPTDPKAWKVIDTKEGKAYSQFKQSAYKPRHRSPLNYSLIKDVVVGDFVFEAKMQSTVKDYGHRDLCVFFGWQNPQRFYYVHLGKKADDHANQVFIVNDKERVKISKTTTKGTDWTDGWHRIKVMRKVKDGTIEVYFDDMKKPVMTASDRTFTWGQVGVGSFDDTGNWREVKLSGVKVEKPKE
jgi:hypothetical protein